MLFSFTGLAQQNYRIIWYDRRFLHFFWLNAGFYSIRNWLISPIWLNRRQELCTLN